MRTSDQPVVVGMMDRAGSAGVMHDVDARAFAFSLCAAVEASEVEMPTTCKVTEFD